MFKVRYFYLLSLLLLAGCIAPFSPDLNGEAENIYVISGEVTNHEGYQYVSISNPHCVDCRKYGGVLEKPEFWPY